MYIISACLIGENCKYNGESNPTQWVLDFVEDKNVIAVCPEELGGLTTPRDPSEQQGNRVVSRSGRDVTREFHRGAEAAFRVAMAAAELVGEPIQGAILKARSPSCGRRTIYDGNFNGTIIEGDGIFARLLTELGIPVITEEEEEKKGELL
jgi:uncharacterized protein YbbK (DUF523 family)